MKGGRFVPTKFGNLVARAIRNTIRANRFARIIRKRTPISIAHLGLAYNHSWMLTTLGCPFNSDTLLLWTILFVGPSEAQNSAYYFVHFSKGQHSEHLACLVSLRSLIFSELMPPVETFCFLRVCLHLSLPTQNWSGLIQGERDRDQGQERTLLLWRSFRTGDAQFPQVRNSKIRGQELRKSGTCNSETRKAKAPELRNSKTTVTPVLPEQSNS